MAKFCILLFTCGVTLALTTSISNARHVNHQHLRHYQRLHELHLRAHTTGLHRRKAHSHHARRRGLIARSVSLEGVNPVLAAKARQIVNACGSTIVSAVSRRGYRSNHPIGRAVDLTGAPSCIYQHLRSWPGGYSIDYAAVGHVHVSYNPGGQEWGLRFRHRHGEPHVTRYANGVTTRQNARLARNRAREMPQLYTAILHRPQ